MTRGVTAGAKDDNILSSARCVGSGVRTATSCLLKDLFEDDMRRLRLWGSSSGSYVALISIVTGCMSGEESGGACGLETNAFRRLASKTVSVLNFSSSHDLCCT